ncbi:MAG: septum formation initiator family protein [Firmicutes bacterium]|nr:septum formation initiator family protein [Bacillota bacterium]
MPKRKRRNRRSFLHILLCVLLVLTTVLCLWAGMIKIMDMIQIKQSLIENQEKSEDLKKELEDLKEEEQNLKNPEYLEQIARGKYQFSKEGEQVFKFPKEE